MRREKPVFVMNESWRSTAEDTILGESLEAYENEFQIRGSNVGRCVLRVSTFFMLTAHQETVFLVFVSKFSDFLSISHYML